MFAGVTRPTSGRLSVAGEEVSSDSLQLSSLIGYLPESPAFYGWMTGREFLLFSGELYGHKRETATTRAEEMLSRVDVGEAADRRIKSYSRGMQQRLGIAQALMNRPAVLLLDEPASALDPLGRCDMLETIAALKGETTVFISTHILADVERICDRVAIVDCGRLVTQGSIEELRAQRRGAHFEVEFEEDATQVVGRLDQVPWVDSSSVIAGYEHRVLHVEVADLERAKRELPRLLVESGLTLLRYELSSASLEDIFIELVGGDGADR